jgi:glycosyltransferase involved in cell wall biosynthesis
MALRTPVVSTSKGAEGLEAVDGEHLLIGNTPETFAQKVIQLMTEPDLRDAIRSGAYDLVDKMYNWDVVAPRFLHLVETIAKS